jgi:hypothetical protein
MINVHSEELEWIVGQTPLPRRRTYGSQRVERMPGRTQARAKQQIDFRIEKERSDHGHGLSVPTESLWSGPRGTSIANYERADAATTRIEDSLAVGETVFTNSVSHAQA